jgi:hypothetical protein
MMMMIMIIIMMMMMITTTTTMSTGLGPSKREPCSQKDAIPVTEITYVGYI